MLKRQIPKTSYELMRDSLEEIVKKHDVDLSKCYAFEEYLLDFAGVSEKPKFCCFGSYLELNVGTNADCVFMLEISQAALKQFLTINEQILELRATDVTAQVADGKTVIDGHPCVIVRMNADALSHPCVVVRMNADALREHCLPKFSSYLEQHPEAVWHNQNVGNIGNFSYKKLSDMTHEMFMSEGMSTYKSDCFEETLCLIVQESFARAENINLAIAFLIPRTLLRLIKEYLNIEDYDKPEVIQALTTTVSRYDASEKKYHTDLFLTTPTSSACLLEKFFNRMHPGSSVLDSKQHDVEDGAKAMTKLTILNQTLCHPGFLSDVNDRMKHYSLVKKDEYRKKSETITLTTAECLGKLDECRVKLAEQKHKSADTLHSLITQVRQHGVEDAKTLSPLLQQLNALVKEKTKNQGKPSLLMRFTKVFSAPDPTPILIEMKSSLADLDKIINKCFKSEVRQAR